MKLKSLCRPLIAATALIGAAALLHGAVKPDFTKRVQSKVYAKTFDTHWQRLSDDYPYFELYQVDWDQERRDHRPLALAAKNDDEFAWEIARLISALPDPHVSFLPSMKTVKGKWSIPDAEVRFVERRIFVTRWPKDEAPTPPPKYQDDPYAYPEIIEIRGEAPSMTTDILVAGPVGTSFDIRLRWPDGTEMEHILRRPHTPNLPPPPKHLGEDWLISGKVGSVGYIHIKTFDPDLATLGPDGKITTMLRKALKELADADSIILDFQGNGGGLVAASDPFLGHFLKRSQSYQWGNAKGKRRVIRTQRPRYNGKLVVIVDEASASGGEWAARILRDAGRATVIGGRTKGAEAAVLTSNGPDGSVVKFGGWPMIEPGIKPFQEVGVEVDFPIPLLIQDVHLLGYEQALAKVRRARIAKACEVLGAPESTLEDLFQLASK